MNTLFTLIVALQVITAIVIIGLVLVQHGKGADMGAAFGSGASGSLFGATGSSSFLSRATGVAATIFFCTTLALAYLGNRHTAPSGGVMENLASPKVEAVPTTSSTPTATSRQNVEKTDAATPASKNRVDQIPK